MMNSGMLGVDQEKLRQLQEVTKHIKAEIIVNKRKGTLELHYMADNPQAAQAIPGLVEHMAGELAQSLYVVFAMQGKRINLE